MKMDLYNEILMATCQLYGNLRFSRNDVQFIIEFVQNFVENIYNPRLHKQLSENLYNAVSEEATDEIRKTFKKYKNVFGDFNTEDKRLRIYKQHGFLIDPIDVPIASSERSSVCGEKISIKNKYITITHIPLKYSLTQFLQIDRLFDALIEYKDFLMQDQTALTNFVQGQLWKKQLSEFDKDGVVLPLFGYHDDVETGNSMGSHSKINEVGAVYATIPCLPTNFASKLESIVMSDIFYSNDRKQYGNALICKSFIADLKKLREEGIEIQICNKKIKVYFITSLILGDNLGLNSMLGFTSSFTKTMWCRICYASPDKIHFMTNEDERLLRTVESYKNDVKKLCVSESGVNE
ncbi:uncharacterized protein LOC103317579 [Nasonia vitripennis]|uniref:Uncharacterized protein n=1 Tax=Nasonia vitripennis TaxID=7425 RepID=A0A7M7QKB7_NASVI|nr:uncharacterized protein LOC103317579 [Nasonia vitripennis]XP_031788721.1 uncharacterized protein LOC103317579 [Nasonia vitripennis]XP_031788722.1 uncharacterized protein LOC103317579 [Nasonia vitripennis]